MDTQENGEPQGGPERARAGGRSERVRREVGDAVLSLLAEGRFSFTFVEVAERAGVSRRTLYRWWPTREELMREGLSRHVRRAPRPDTVAWESDVRTFARDLAEFAADPIEVATGALLASRDHSNFAELLIAQYQPVLDA